ncbi:unnamed protein product [Urochloa decumbens]|uniref:Trichome birefringence-like N-terminal domain-containing protein n=1 Tax=Urochloa decumbens TaxID=240449 RepID=A0ABC9DEY9_9POAL
MGAYKQPLNQKPSSSKNPGCFLSRPVCFSLVCGILSLALLHLLCCSPAATQQAVFSPLRQYINNTYSSVSSVPGEGIKNCNYSEGQWVWAPGHARRYNATECNVKERQDCLRNGRPDTGYLDWRWQPAGCPLPAFDARTFLSAVRGKHVAFIGDSMARNQAQSLICLLTSAYPYYRLLYRDVGQHRHNFWSYSFPSYNVKVSYYWAPFLVRGKGKPEDDAIKENHVHLDVPGDRWAADADTIDVAVLAAGHWLLNGAIYYNGSEVIGAHNAPDELNYTRIGYAWPLHVAYRTAVERLSSGGGRPRTVVLATFSPSHFEGRPVDSPTACTKMEPYKEGERELEWIFKEVRDVVYDEAELARARVGGGGDNGGATRIEVLDVTKLAWMRPDGHPSVYMNYQPFEHGVPEKMNSDCLHFCLPGPVDTFNEILVQVLKRRP